MCFNNDSAAHTTHVAILPAQSLLNAMDGIAYLTDRSGTILGVGTGNWNAFDRKNSDGVLPPHAVIGKSVFDFISGNDVRRIYVSAFEDILLRKRGVISFPMRCDSPAVRRETRMSISPVFEDGRITAVLFQSQILSEIDRPPMNIFNCKPQNALNVTESMKIVRICSYCHNIANDNHNNDARGAWITPEEYYLTGGNSEVLLSHSICPRCYEKLQA